jgi:hypothetical protein
MSARADDRSTGLLQKAIPEMAAWPITLAVESRPGADFMLVMPPLQAANATNLEASAGSNTVSPTAVH